MLRYFVGALAGGAVGYFALYRWAGCSAGVCTSPINPYAAVAIGAVLGLLVAAVVRLPGRPAPESGGTQAVYHKLAAKDAKARMDSGDEVIILDVRTQSEYDGGHIPGAILIPNETIDKTPPAQLPDLDAEILVYCRSGSRSAQAAKKLVAMGYTGVYDFGGIISWPYGVE